MTTCRETEAGECARASVAMWLVEQALDDYAHAVYGLAVADEMVETQGCRNDLLCNLSEAERNAKRARRVILALATPSVPATRTPTPRTDGPVAAHQDLLSWALRLGDEVNAFDPAISAAVRERADAGRPITSDEIKFAYLGSSHLSSRHWDALDRVRVGGPRRVRVGPPDLCPPVSVYVDRVSHAGLRAEWRRLDAELRALEESLDAAQATATRTHNLDAEGIW